MKLGLPWRIGLVIALTGVLAAGLAGFYAYRASRQLLVDGAEARLLTATRVLARQLAVALNASGRDVLLLARHPTAARLLERVDPQPLQQRSERNSALLLEGIVRIHPEYRRLSLIDAQDHGLERIRIDRDAQGQVRSAAAEDLLEKAHLPYVYETLRLAPGAVYLSAATINRESGTAASARPSIQMATAVYDERQQARGVVVVDIDLDGLFRQLAADLPAGLRLMLLNRGGDYLIHPDPARAFAFDRGQRGHVLDDFPAAQALLGKPPTMEGIALSAVAGERLLAAFVRQPPTEMRLDEAEFIIGLAQPLDDVLVEGEHLGAVVLRIALAVSLVSMLLAALLARALTRPLLQIVVALRGFTGHGPQDASLPCERGDEIGLLARSVRDMQQQISSQFEALEAKQGELDHLASRDGLTGLLNRRVFLDRLEHAVALARRTQGQLALLFVDLDRFKAINDQYGHAAGDAVLQTLALRLQQLVREADTVARIGGDEFVILLDHAEGAMAAETVAEKVRQALVQPIAFGALQLQAGASIGIGRYPQDGADVSELLAAADRAMYAVKFAGAGDSA
jgi:diguanylate cyclase (GGDEF)-like protein